MKSLVVHSITKVIRSLRDPKTTLVEYGNVRNRCKMAHVIDIDILYLRIRRDRKDRKKGIWGGAVFGLKVVAVGGVGR